MWSEKNALPKIAPSVLPVNFDEFGGCSAVGQCGSQRRFDFQRQAFSLLCCGCFIEMIHATAGNDNVDRPFSDIAGSPYDLPATAVPSDCASKLFVLRCA